MKRIVKLKENRDFRRAYNKGEAFVSPYFVVYILKKKTEKVRLGITVSKKIGGAVERNRAKRIIRHAYKNIDTLYGVKTGHLIVIVAREAIAGKKTNDIEREMTRALKKLELI